ncbi:hypothetical protein JCM3775_002564 [Rhodotorula graminis]
MAHQHLYVHGPTHEPFNPRALDEDQALVDFPPDEALQTWYHEPAATALQRYRDGHVSTRLVPEELYYDAEKRWTWKQDVLKVNEVWMARNGAFWAKLDNWFALVPLPLVLQAYDRLYDEPSSPSVDLRTHQVEAFALLLLDLGIDPGTTAATATAHRLDHLAQWLESECPEAIQFWLALYTHVYHNARAAPGGPPWATRLARLEIGQGCAAWSTYIQHVETGLNTGRLPSLFTREATYFSNFVAPELLVSPVMTDLFGTPQAPLAHAVPLAPIAPHRYHPQARPTAVTDGATSASPTTQPSQVRDICARIFRRIRRGGAQPSSS